MINYFFIKFTPDRTLRPRWYLVAVDLESTYIACPDYLTTNTYWCVFQARHPADKGKSDEQARWWPEWHKYHRDTNTNVIIFDERILFPPNRIPPKDKYIEWAEDIVLAGEASTSLIGSFNFQPCDEFNRVRRTVSSDKWNELKTICTKSGLMPPTLGSKSSHIPSRPRKEKRRTR